MSTRFERHEIVRKGCAVAFAMLTVLSLMAVAAAHVLGEPDNYARSKSAGEFRPPYSDFGLDTDSDGLYNYLVIDAGLEVTDPGFFYIGATLYDQSANSIASTSNYTYLDSGVHGVQLLLDGTQIWRFGADGPYDVYLSLINDTLDTVDADTHTTAVYQGTDFQNPPAVLSPPHLDYGMDTDSDGLYNYLVVGFNVTVMMSGYYYIDCSLYNESYNYYFFQSNSTDLDVGLRTIFVAFDGIRIRNFGYDGAYHVSISLYHNGSYLEGSEYTTSSYLWTDFQTPPAEFAPPCLDHGLDSGSDGLFDYLVIEIPVDVSVGGTYYVSGEVYDQSDKWITSCSNSTYLDVGIQTVEARVDGWKISANGVDGPFYINLVLQTEGYQWLDSYTHFTSAYLWSEFQPPTVLLPPHSDYGLDTDGDGKWNHLVVEVVVDVAFAGYFNLYGTLNDKFGGWIYQAQNYTCYLDLGLQIVEFRYDGLVIRDHGIDGPYVVDISLSDASMVWLDSDTHNTSAYLWTEFQRPQAEFEPPHSDHGEDDDGDGLFDHLIVEARVNVTQAGVYYLSANLYDDYSMIWMGSAYVYTDMDVGLSVIAFGLNGVRIRNSGIDGPYLVDLDIQTVENWTWLDSDQHITAPYLCTDFQTPPAILDPPHPDHGLDTDSDGYYNYLVVDVSVIVLDAGSYQVSGSLQDAYRTIDSMYKSVLLSVGHQTVELRFDGLRIRGNGVDGPYTVSIELWGMGYDLGDNYTTTAAYLWEEFQKPPAAFEPPHSDHGVDIDSDGLYEYLVVDVVINATSAGSYRVEGFICDKNGTWFGNVRNDTFIETGVHVVELRYDGASIRREARDGPYRMELTLFNVVGKWLDSDQHNTSRYDCTDFEIQSSFGDIHTDFGLDTDGDGLFNELRIGVSVNVTVPGWYAVSGGLRHNESFGIDSADNNTYLEAGLQIVELSFDGPRIRSSGFDGPYEVVIELMDLDPWWTVVDSDSYNTSAYLTTDFDPPAAVFKPPHSDRAVDEDSDGYYDYLVVEATVEVSEAGYYRVEGGMEDSIGGWIGEYEGHAVYLEVGTQTLELRFPGPFIWDHGVDGPYEVSMSLYAMDAHGDEGNWLCEGDHTTGYYQWEEFLIQSSLEPPYSDYGLDVDGDGLFDYLVVSVMVNITQSGDYRVGGTLEDEEGFYITYASEEFSLGKGLHTIELEFNGFEINKWGKDGPYTLEFRLAYEDEAYDYDSYNTSAYGWAEFQSPSRFSPPHSDHGLDTDSDGAFDFLIMEAVVNISSSATYFVEARLCDGFGHHICWHSNTTYLSAGLNVVELRFEGYMIRENGVSGPFEIELTLRTADMDWIDYDEYYTSSYLPSEFEAPPPPLTAPWLDDFESGDLGGTTGVDWYSADSSLAGISDQVSEPGSSSVEPGTCSMFVSGRWMEVKSYSMDLSGQATAELRVWIMRGDDISGDRPEDGDDLEIYYMDSSLGWELLDVLSGDGTPGESFVLTYQLPSDALHSQFRIRFVLTDGDGPGTDYWFIDNVYVGPPVAPRASLELSPSIGDVTTVFTFDSSLCSDFEDTPDVLMVRWDWESDGVWDTGWSTEKVAYHQFLIAGQYIVTVELMDSQGLTNTTTVHLEVVEVIPEFSGVLVPVMVMLLLAPIVIGGRIRRRRS